MSWWFRNWLNRGQVTETLGDSEYSELIEGLSVATGLGGTLSLPTNEIDVVEGETVRATAMDNIVDLYSPDIMLDFDQSSGSTIPDVSGNSRDFTADGTEGVDFTWGVSGHLAGTTGRIELTSGATWTSDAAFNDAHTFVLPAKTDMTGTVGYLFDVQSQRILLRGKTNEIATSGKVSTSTAYDADTDNEFTYGLGVDATNLDIYVNGLKIHTTAGTDIDFASGTTWTIGQRFDGTHISSGDYDGFFFYKNSKLTDDDMYEIYRRASGGQRHHYKENIEGTSLTTGLVMALPLWEVDGADAMDVSGNENHAPYVGGVTLGQTPVGDSNFWLYSVRATSTTGVDTTTGIDITTDDFTISFLVNFTTFTSRIIWEIGSSTANTIRFVELAGNYRLQIYNTAAVVHQNTGTISASTGTDVRLTVTWDASAEESKTYVNGVPDNTQTGSTGTILSTSALTEQLNGTATANYTGFYKWSRVLSDAEVAAL